jgi:hypothetical protein
MQIEATALSSFTGAEDAVVSPVTMKPLGECMRLHFQDTGKYAGLVTLPALGKLQRDFNVKLTAHLVATKNKPDSKSKRGERKRDPGPSCEYYVRIVIHGLKSEKTAVGDLLANDEVFFQHPSIEECGRNMEYWNPHYLLRPGSQMPLLEDLSISSDESSAQGAGTLEEVDRSRLLRIFDTASDIVIPSKITPSPRLRSILKE